MRIWNVMPIGGGTFDISVLMMAAGSSSSLNLEGDMWLGGDDFDQVIVDYVIEHVKKEYGINPTQNHRFMVMLKMEAQKAKETLSSARVADLLIQGILQDDSGNIIDVEVEITREWFEEKIKPLVERTISLARRAVENAHFTLNDIDCVLMAGNATCIPKVQEAMEQLFDKEKISRKIHPKNSVAMGAAMAAALFKEIECPKCRYNNHFESKKCEKCDTPLIGILDKKTCPSCGTENTKETTRCKNNDCKSPFLVIDSIKGGIASFHYGVQTAGDKFNISIKKNAQYETPEDERMVQTFFTRYPNQRTSSIPVYGGDNLESASKNTKQGEAFAILPPGCPEGTPIRIKIWLNKDGQVELTAQLEDGRDLQPWLMRGDLDQKAMEILQKAERIIVDKKDILSPGEKEEVDRLRNELLGKMQERDFESAEKKVEDLIKVIEEAGKEADPLRAQAEGMSSYGTYIVNQYGWLIDQSVYRLNNLMGQLQEALDKNDRNLMEDKLNELMKEIDRLMQTKDHFGNPIPTLLGIFLGAHGAITSIIQPVDPVDSINLREKLTDIERAFKDKRGNAMNQLNAFAEKLNKAIEEIQKIKPEGIKCPSCGHLNSIGIRYCEECRADLWILGHERAATPTTGKIKW